MKHLLAAGTALAMLTMGSSAFAVTFPPFGADTLGPQFIVTLNPGGTGTVSNGPGFAQGPYDGSDDAYIGVINNSGQTVSAVGITCKTACFAFDGDGIDTYGAPGNAKDTTGYGGPLTYYTGINGALTAGTGNFIGGLGNGASTYFSLETPLSTTGFTVTSGVPEPSTWAMMLLGFVGLAFGFRQSRRRVSLA